MKLSSFPLLICLLVFTPMASGSATKDNTGKKLPELNVKIVENKPAAIKGRPRIIEFWATWCGPCVKNIPHLNELHQKYKDQGLVIIGITDESLKTIRHFMRDNPMHYAVAIDAKDELSKVFGIKGIPHALLVDPSGTIVWEGHPSSLKESQIEKVLTSGLAPSRPLPKAL